MKMTKQGIALAITLILCFSLNQTAENSLNDTMQQEGSSLAIDEQQIKAFLGGTEINFDDKGDGDPIGTSYPGLDFSPGYTIWNPMGDIHYPPESGENIAYSHELNNWLIFDMPIQKVGLFVSTAVSDYELVVTAYTNQSVAIEEISITANTSNQYIEFNSPLGRIYNISVSGLGGFTNHWTIDTLSYLEFTSPTPNLIDFEDLTDGTMIYGKYTGLVFSPDFQIWNSIIYAPYPPHSGNNVAYSLEMMANITFSFPVESVSFYINTGASYNMQILAYSESGILLERDYVYGNTVHQYVTLRSLLGMIHRITIIGDTGFNNYWTMDDLCYVEYIPNENQLLTFDELAEGTYVEDIYDGITFSPNYIVWESLGDVNYPPQSGAIVIYSNELVNNITFDIPKSYVSFYVCAVSDYNIRVKSYNVDDVLIQIVDVEPSSINQLVELYSLGGFIHRISISGTAGFEDYWAIDTLYFEYKETFEFLLDFEDYPDSYLDVYPHISFSAEFISWKSIGNSLYSPNSGKHVAYSHELNPNMTFTIPIMYASFYICSPNDYSLDVLVYSSEDELIFKVSVEPDSVNKFVEIYSNDSEISRITFNGTSGYITHWTIDNLYYMANIYTYDLDGDGLSYNEEMIYNTDPLDWDSDDDGLTDGEEVNTYGTNPNNTDTDTDGMPDGWEVDNSLNPLVDDSGNDPDTDGLTNLEEYTNNTDPQDSDSDDDSFSDGEEIAAGTDPNDPLDHPIIIPEFGYVSLILFVPFIVVLGLLFRRRK